MCRTDLNIVEGDLAPHHPTIVPGHQIVGIVTAAGPGVTRRAAFAVTGRENLCDHPVYTGYDVDGGYAHAVVARADFAHPLRDELDDLHAAPLLCAGIIGFRALRVAGVQHGEHVGLYGFGSSAHLALPILESWGCTVSVVTRGADHRATAEKLGAETYTGRAAISTRARQRGTQSRRRGRDRRFRRDHDDLTRELRAAA